MEYKYEKENVKRLRQLSGEAMTFFSDDHIEDESSWNKCIADCPALEKVELKVDALCMLVKNIDVRKGNFIF